MTEWGRKLGRHSERSEREKCKSGTMTTETTVCKRSGIPVSKADRGKYRGDINWEVYTVTAAVDTNKADNTLLEFGMFIGRREGHKNQRANMIPLSFLAGDSSRAQSNNQGNDKSGKGSATNASFVFETSPVENGEKICT